MEVKEIHRKTKKMLEIETKTKERVEETLRRLFVDENKSHKEIAKELSISYVTVVKWLNLAGIHSRKLNIRDT